ncbi:MAG TPA: twin-arginine translocase subunit TatC [Egibacteraceae bacterium]|jgi:sec-independent protein translocase protein TatC|nr:twin-arginine translocase subunit TatC [Egibacteraceae bacterium]
MTATATPRDAGGDSAPPAPGEMTLFEHLNELRSRLFKSAVAVVLGFLVGFLFRHQVFSVLIRPYCELDPALRAGSQIFDAERCQLIVTEPLAMFFLSLKAAAVVAVVLAAPYVCYQIWRFVTPGLEPVERKYALPFVVISQLLFVGGAVFSYIVIPRGLEFLLSLAGEDVVALLDANAYLGFMLQVMISFGLAFEFPLVLVMLSLMGVVTAASLRRWRRHALFGTFVAAAIITPTQDPLTMALMAAPLVAFYELSILVARYVERRRRRQEALSSA